MLAGLAILPAAAAAAAPALDSTPIALVAKFERLLDEY
jgi:hypothetical protein